MISPLVVFALKLFNVAGALAPTMSIVFVIAGKELMAYGALAVQRTWPVVVESA
jgi:hypothetical protein